MITSISMHVGSSTEEREAFDSLKVAANATNTKYYIGTDFTTVYDLLPGETVDVSFDTYVEIDGAEPLIIYQGTKQPRGFREGLQSALTSAQLAAVNSGITAEILNKLTNKGFANCGISYSNGRFKMHFIGSDVYVTSSDFPILAMCDFNNYNDSLYSDSSIDVDVYGYIRVNGYQIQEPFIGTRRLIVDKKFFARFPEHAENVLVYINESSIFPIGLEAIKDIYQLQKQPTWYVVHNTNEPDINEYLKKDAWKNIIPNLKVGDLVIYLDKAYEVLDMDEDYEDKPEDPGEEPEEPVEPEEPDLEEPSLDDYEDEDEYQEALAEYQDAMSAYQKEYAEYESAMASYEEEHEAWRIKSEAYDSFVPPITPNFNQVLNGGQSQLTEAQLAAINSGITATKRIQYDNYDNDKQKTLSVAQMAAVDSGITAAKVAQYDGYVNGKQNKLTSAQLDAVNSGITSAKVTKFEGYESQIAEVAALTSANSLCSWKKYDAITGDNAYPNFTSLVSGNTTAWHIDNDTLVGNIEIDATKGNRIFDFRNLKDANDEPIPVDFAVNIAGFTSYETIIFFKGIDVYSISPTSPLAMSSLCFCGEEPDLDTEKEYVLSIQGNTFIFGELSRGVDAKTEEE